MLAIVGFGQGTSGNCPGIVVSGPMGVTLPGDQMSFTVDLVGPQILGSPGYTWTVSAGSIVSGQGTRSITVETAGAGSGMNVTATVSVQGSLPGCANTASETAPIAALACGLSVDDYGEIAWNAEQAHLDNVQISLNQNPGYKLFIYLRIKADESFDVTRKHAIKMIKHFLWRDKDFDVSRVVVIMYVDDRHSTVFNIAPPNAKPTLCETGCIQLAGPDLVKK